MKLITKILFLLIGFSNITLAQKDTIPPIITDRPTQSTSPYFLPKGYFQIETGFIATDRTDQVDHLQMFSLGNTNFRYGIFKNFEVNVTSSYEVMNVLPLNTEKDSTISGMGPVSAGFKTFVCSEKGIRPAIAIIGIINFRHIGNETFAPTFSYPLGKLAATHNITKNLSLGYNVGFSLNGETSDGFFIYSGYMGYLITPRLSSFAEVYGKFDHGDFPRHRGDAGFTYVMRQNLQLDLSGGIGFNKNIKRYFVSAGLSWRIPN